MAEASETSKEVIKALKSCKAYSRKRILKKASLLSTEQRLALVEYFGIELQELPGQIVLFWSQIQSTQTPFSAALKGDFFTA